MGIKENNGESVQKLSLPWLEDELKKFFEKEEITSHELEQIKYFSISIDGGFIIEISLEEPPVPYTTPWGGEEWEYCVLNGSQIKEYVDWIIENDYSKIKIPNSSEGYCLSTSPISYKHEEYELSDEDIAKAKKFGDTVSELHYSEAFSNDEEWEKWFIETTKAVGAELEKFPNLKVIRLHEGTYKDFTFVEKLVHLEVLELVEADFEGIEGFDKLPNLKQLCCWLD